MTVSLTKVTPAMTGSRLDLRFFARPTLTLARSLIGQQLVRQVAGRRLGGIIVETEAYIGEEDLACHAAAGRTARTEVMYGPPGHAYVYLVYGMHHCLNVVSEAVEFPAAVLIRALEPTEGILEMATHRRLGPKLEAEVRRRGGGPGADHGGRRREGAAGTDLTPLLSAASRNPGPIFRSLLSGPGKLCQALAIDRRLSGTSLLGSDLFLEAGRRPRHIMTTERIGVDYAGPWREKPWRFVVTDSPWISRPPTRRGIRPPGAARPLRASQPPC